MENKNYTVEVSKDFSVSKDNLYDAWTKPELLKEWWKPMNNKLTEVTNDISEGGTVRYEFENNGLVISGEYIEVKEKERLVYTWNWNFPQDEVKNASYKLTVQFKVKDDSSTLQITQDNFHNEEGTLPHKQGWDKALEELEHFLSGDTVQKQTEEDLQFSRAAGYNESPEQVKVGGG
jgi:uncharacterized protein YndB with AHSA1/START domain